MALKNTLRSYRRHIKECDSKQIAAGLAPKKPTFHPHGKRQEIADNCTCPIVAQGYLTHHVTPDGKQKRILHLSLGGVTTWTEANIEIAKLLEAGKLPWCAAHKITSMKAFEDKDTCQRFVESWRMLVRREGEELSQPGKEAGLNLFKAFLNFSVEAGFLSKNGAKKLFVTQDAEVNRYGLELDEYKRILTAIKGTDLKANETRAALELMRYTGMRIVDCAKFNRAELVPNVSGNGFNANFIQKKTGKRCIVPVPAHVVALLNALPVRESGNYFSVSRFVIADRLQAIFDTVKTKHKVTPHCLRHTFAIQLITAGVEISIISKWMGHEKVSTTQEHYQNIIDSTKVEFERIARETVQRMLDKTSAA